MKVEQIYTGCLAQGAYYISSAGEAAIIDPLREVSPYMDRAKKDGVKIKYIFETHFHADFVSGHLTLSKETGAPIVYGPNADPTFEATIAEDGQEFKIGKLTLKVLHTPGHTMESTTYLLKDESGKDYAIFSGDTLFLGDVGRPDLAQKKDDITQEQLASTLYHSLRNKIMPLADDVIVYPAHGAGSACGKNMMKITKDSLGNQKEMNYALRSDMTVDEFVKEVTDGLEAPPAYFPLNVKMNREGYAHIDEILANGTKALAPVEFEVIANETDAIVLDVRHQDDFKTGHIPGSLFIGLNGGFAPWVGDLIKDVEQKILLVVPEGKAEEAVTRLSRVGFDKTMGYLDGGLDAWKGAGKEIDTLDGIDAAVLAEKFLEKELAIFDVRKSSEYGSEHLDNVESTPLSKLNEHMASFPSDKPFFVHCAGGYRSVIACSILKARGFHNLIDVEGGFAALKKTALPRSGVACSNH